MKSNRGSAALGMSILFFAIMASAAYYKDNGLYDVGRLREEIAAIRMQSQILVRENKMMREELDGLKFGEFIVESITREDLGLVKPNEVVYEFIDSKILVDPLGRND